MGQYYMPTSMDEKEQVYSHDFGSGLKLVEHSYIGNDFVNTVMLLLLDTASAKKFGETHKDETDRWVIWDKIGSWSGKKFIWAGNYSDGDPELPPKMIDGVPVEINWFAIDNNIEVPFKEILLGVPFYRGLFIFNHSKREYIDMWEYISNAPVSDWGSIIHPLPLLTCAGNGRGGGDYRGKNKRVGSWAKNKISISTEGFPDDDDWNDVTGECYFKEG